MKNYELNRFFQKHKTSCKYAISGSFHAFTRIDFERGLIYLHEGGINAIPVRLSDVSDVHDIELGKMVLNAEGVPEWSKENED